MSSVELREILQSDVAVFFEQQLDAESNRMAAFGATEPSDRPAFFARWSKILGDESIISRAILVSGGGASEAGAQLAGHVLCFGHRAEREVCYWLGSHFWGRGVASNALAQFLELVRERPLFARAVKDNVGSLRVLEKCGFVVFATDSGFSRARGCDVEEFVVRLD
jgi:RimJ/RimL family protein N-acetyltransferase